MRRIILFTSLQSWLKFLWRVTRIGKPDTLSPDSEPNSAISNTEIVESESSEPSVTSKCSDQKRSEQDKLDGPQKDVENGNSVVTTIPTYGKNNPNKTGGRRKAQAASSFRPSPSSFCPHLVCRKIRGSTRWEVILIIDDKDQSITLEYDGNRLEIKEGRCQIPSLRGSLAVTFENGSKNTIPLFEDEPLIFKLSKNWAGEGYRTSRVTIGHYIIIVPLGWKRVGRAPIEPDLCSDNKFTAHYLHRAKLNESIDGFNEWKKSLVGIGIRLAGRTIYDDSDHGVLFAGDPPILKHCPEFEWARVGEEVKQGWGQNFKPSERKLSEVLNGRAGRFFLRVYDRKMDMLDSVAFRYISNLHCININGIEYAQSTVFPPEETTGYSSTEIHLVGTNGKILTPVLPRQSEHEIASSGAILIPPHPDADRVMCSLESKSREVGIIINLSRVWWRLDGCSNSNEWTDISLVMTRDEFKKQAHAGTTLSILSKQHSVVVAGFDDCLEQQYRRKMKDDYIAIPLAHFVDHAQVDQKLTEEAHFCVEWAGKKLPLIRISADPVLEILSFTSDPPQIKAGESTVLKWSWEARNAKDVRASIKPVIDSVKSTGSVSVKPAASTNFTLRLEASGIDALTKNVSVEVNIPLEAPVDAENQFMREVEKLQYGEFYEYYRGFLGGDTTVETNHLRKVTQYLEKERIITLVQGKLKSENGKIYYAVRTSNAISTDLQRELPRKVDRIP